jgi:hypothetical protein
VKLKLIEAPIFCSACNTRKAGFSVDHGQCNACEIGCYPESGETKRTDEELLQSWRAVLSEYAPREQAGSRC